MPSFTYDLTATGDDLLVSKVRLAIGDTTEGVGIKPNGENFDDSEILVALDDAGDIVNLASAYICQWLSTSFAQVADLRVGPRHEKLSDISKAYQLRAERLAGGTTSMESYSVGVIKVDGYSNDIPSDKVSETGSEYEGSFRYVRPA